MHFQYCSIAYIKCANKVGKRRNVDSSVDKQTTQFLPHLEFMLIPLLKIDNGGISHIEVLLCEIIQINNIFNRIGIASLWLADLRCQSRYLQQDSACWKIVKQIQAANALG